MNISDFSIEQERALVSMLNYWVAHWDCECPTLFGLELPELQAVLKEWPQSLKIQEQNTALALVGAQREFLFGASSVPKDEVYKITGITYTEAVNLFGLFNVTSTNP